MFARFTFRITLLHIAVALVALTLAVFGPFVTNAFVSLDDNYLIYANPAVKTLSFANIAHVFTHYDPQLYIPLTFLSFQLNAAIFGMNATAFHLVNLLLHAANVVLVLLIIRRLSGNLLIATVTATLFAIHPIQTEAVLWAASRKDLLSGFFFLLSTLFYLRYREKEWHRRALWWSIAFFVLGLLSKVSVIMLPVWFLGIDWLQGRKLEKSVFGEKLSYSVAALLFGVIAVIGKSRILQSSGTILNVLLPARSIVFYVQKTLWPVGLSVIYPYTGNGSELLRAFGFAALLIVTSLAILIWLVTQGKHRLVAFALGTYFLLLVPSFTTFWKNGFLYFASDRYVYLASIGIFLLAGLLLQWLRTRFDVMRDVVMISFAGLLCLLIFMTRAQSAVWSNTIALYQNVLRFYPDSVMAQTNLGLELQHAGDRAGAREHYERAIALDPHSVHAYFDLASLASEEKNYDEEETLYLRIIDAFTSKQLTSQTDLKPFLWLADTFEKIGQQKNAERLLRRVITVVPAYPEPHFALGELLRNSGDDAGAFRELRTAAEKGSRDPHTYYYLVEYYSAGSGTTLDIIGVLKKGVALDPENAFAKQKLDELMQQTKR